jgi:hypothetical protein
LLALDCHADLEAQLTSDFETNLLDIAGEARCSDSNLVVPGSKVVQGK